MKQIQLLQKIIDTPGIYANGAAIRRARRNLAAKIKRQNPPKRQQLELFVVPSHWDVEQMKNSP